MKPIAILGVVLIVFGLAALAYQGITYTTKETVIDISSRTVDRRIVAKRFRESPHGRTMVLVALSLPAHPRDADGPSEDGFDFHLPTPVDAAHLARLLGDVAMAAG